MPVMGIPSFGTGGVKTQVGSSSRPPFLKKLCHAASAVVEKGERGEWVVAGRVKREAPYSGASVP